ncbi:membrane protein [Arthrobacter phage KeAlii]|uniref:Membrane protein n=1 Tax=Arthrobacter phage KeAlii TaxID=2885973 RepID=A0AA94WVY2_9CAUD|nr:membrane protein [Arthrobacter phage KeAlii]UDL14667.1 membrane protein [Arthrobacter phage KeAlii]
MPLSFMDVLTLHAYQLLASLLFVVAVGAVLFAIAYVFALVEIRQERKAAKNRKEVQ